MQLGYKHKATAARVGSAKHAEVKLRSAAILEAKQARGARTGLVAFPDEAQLVTEAAFDVAVEAVIAQVRLATLEPRDVGWAPRARRNCIACACPPTAAIAQS